MFIPEKSDFNYGYIVLAGMEDAALYKINLASGKLVKKLEFTDSKKCRPKSVTFADYGLQ